MQDNYAPYTVALHVAINQQIPQPQAPVPFSELEERAHVEAAAQYGDYDAHSLTSIETRLYNQALGRRWRLVCAEEKKRAADVSRIMHALEDYYAHHHLPRPDSFRRLAQAYLVHCEMNREDIPPAVFREFSRIELPEQAVQADDHDAQEAARELPDDQDDPQEAARQIADAEDAAIAARAREHQRNILERCRFAYARALTPEQEEKLEEIVALYMEEQSLRRQLKIAQQAYFQTLATGDVERQVATFLATGKPTAEDILTRYRQALDEGVPQQNAMDEDGYREWIHQRGAFYLINALRQKQQALIAQVMHARRELPREDRRSHAERRAEEEAAAQRVLELVDQAINSCKKNFAFKIWGTWSPIHKEEIQPLEQFKKSLKQAFQEKGLCQEPAAAAEAGARGLGR